MRSPKCEFPKSLHIGAEPTFDGSPEQIKLNMEERHGKVANSVQVSDGIETRHFSKRTACG
jgi:hypothetical protein